MLEMRIKNGEEGKKSIKQERKISLCERKTEPKVEMRKVYCKSAGM